MTEIEQRLINWGSCQRGRGGGTMAAKETRRSSRNGGQGYKCMTSVICDLLKMAAHGPAGGAAKRSKLDFADADLINRAWQKLGPRHRLLLRDLYALGRPVNVICRELDIKHWPARYWQQERQAAEDAIGVIVNGGNQ